MERGCLQPMSRTINVIQGYSAASSFAGAMQPQPGELLVNEDVLSCGPLPPFRSSEEWIQLREAYWDSIVSGSDEHPMRHELLTNTQALCEADSIVLWAGLGAAEQLLLAWVVKLLQHTQSRAQLHVVQFTRAGKHNSEVWGTGSLIPDDFKHHPPALPVPPEALVELEWLWDRVTSPDPAGLLMVLSDERTHLPHSRAGLRRLLERYPDHRTGLTRWESELLKYTKEKGPRALRVVGFAMGYGFDADLVGDLYLFSRLLQLGSEDLPYPLVRVSGDPGNVRSWEVVLTDAGEAVLAGRAHAVELNGIDDWVLGVHLDSKHGAVWYHKENMLVQR
jgi:hypothetical protein